MDFDTRNRYRPSRRGDIAPLRRRRTLAGSAGRRGRRARRNPAGGKATSATSWSTPGGAETGGSGRLPRPRSRSVCEGGCSGTRPWSTLAASPPSRVLVLGAPCGRRQCWRERRRAARPTPSAAGGRLAGQRARGPGGEPPGDPAASTQRCCPSCPSRRAFQKTGARWWPCPCSCRRVEGIQGDLARLETRYLANQDPNLHFALLADFTDAAQPEMPEDVVLAPGSA